MNNKKLILICPVFITSRQMVNAPQCRLCDAIFSLIWRHLTISVGFIAPAKTREFVWRPSDGSTMLIGKTVPIQVRIPINFQIVLHCLDKGVLAERDAKTDLRPGLRNAVNCVQSVYEPGRKLDPVLHLHYLNFPA